MKKYQLGEFEEIVILAIGVLHKDAYGVSIKIESWLSRNVSMGALHTALVRLEDKGILPYQHRRTRPGHDCGHAHWPLDL